MRRKRSPLSGSQPDIPNRGMENSAARLPAHLRNLNSVNKIDRVQERL